MNFELDLLIDPTSLGIIKAAGLNVVLAKSVSSNSNPNVSWIVFDPFQANAITWEENYGIYGSAAQQIQNGATISKMSDLFPATDGVYYSFDNTATFKGPFSNGNVPLGTYQVNNNMPASSYPALTFGLEQGAIVNGNQIAPSPLNATLVPANLWADFTPVTTVWVWLQANFSSATMITQVTGKATTVTFGGGVNQQTLSYDANSGSFIPTSGSGAKLAAADTSHVKLLKASGVY